MFDLYSHYYVFTFLLFFLHKGYKNAVHSFVPEISVQWGAKYSVTSRGRGIVSSYSCWHPYLDSSHT